MWNVSFLPLASTTTNKTSFWHPWQPLQAFVALGKALWMWSELFTVFPLIKLAHSCYTSSSSCVHAACRCHMITHIVCSSQLAWVKPTWQICMRHVCKRTYLNPKPLQPITCQKHKRSCVDIQHASLAQQLQQNTATILPRFNSPYAHTAVLSLQI